jgi:small subunit ribosomal protein S16
MLIIRFQRVGRTNDPAFRIVVTEKHSKPKSGELEIVGSWHGKTDLLRLDGDRIRYWISKGAQPSPRVWNILVDQKIVEGKKVNVVRARPAPVETKAEASREPAMAAPTPSA